jgi:hypothetical protein
MRGIGVAEAATMTTRRIAAFGLFTLGLLACSSAATDAPRALGEALAVGQGPIVSFPPRPGGVVVPPPIGTRNKPRYDQVFRKATHNSYWINYANATGDDPAASGVQERIIDQLLHEHVRGLELDLHYEGGHPGEFTVYHTSDAQANSGCHYLTDCLQLLQRFDYLIPQHEVLTTVLELKENPFGGTFGTSQTGQNHQMEDLDRQLFEHLGSRIYTPREMMSRCPGAPNLVACVAQAGWPTTDELRGRYIFTIDGNWANNYWDWISYANDHGGILSRAAFPIRSMFGTNTNFPSLPADKRAALQAAPNHPWVEIDSNRLSLELHQRSGDGEWEQRRIADESDAPVLRARRRRYERRAAIR